MFAKAPILAWMLMALAVSLAGMAIVEGRYQPAAMPLLASRDKAATVEPVQSPIGTPSPESTGDLGGAVLVTPPASQVGNDRLATAAGYDQLRVARLSIPPDGRLPFDEAQQPTVLWVETGSLTVDFDRSAPSNPTLYPLRTQTVEPSATPLLLAPGWRFAAHNDGSTTAVIWLVTINVTTPTVGIAEPLTPVPTPRVGGTGSVR